MALVIEVNVQHAQSRSHRVVCELRADSALPYPALLIREHERFDDVTALVDLLPQPGPAAGRVTSRGEAWNL